MEKIESLSSEQSLQKATPQPSSRIINSTRLTLFLLFLYCTTNFIYQRFTLNFLLVCMHKPIRLSEPAIGLDDNIATIFDNVTNWSNKIKSSSLLITSNDLENNSSQETSESNVSESKDWISSTNVFELESKKCGTGYRKVNNSDATDSSQKDYFQEFSWSKDTQGSVIAAYYYGLTFSQIPCGWFVDHFGAKKAILLSHFVISVMSLLSPVAAGLGPAYLFGARLLSGVANGAAMPSIFVLATRWCGDLERGSLLGIMSAGFGLAAAVVYPITAFFCERFGWESSFYFGGGTGVLWCILALFIIYEWPELHPRIGEGELLFIQRNRAVEYGGAGKRKPVSPPWKSMLTSIPVWAFIFANFCTFWCFLTISAYLPTYLQEVLNLDISENGLLSAIPYIGMMTVHFLAAFSFDFFRRRNVSVTVLRKSYNSIGMFSSGAAIILISLISCENIPAAVFLLTCSQAFLELPLMGGYMYSIFEIAPKYASSLTSLCNTFGLLTGFVTPAVVAYLTADGTLGQWMIVFYLTGGLMIAGGLVYLVFGKCELLDWAKEGEGNDNENNDGVGVEVESRLIDNNGVQSIESA